MNVRKVILLVTLITLPHILAQVTPKDLRFISNKLFHWLEYNHLKASPGKCHLLLSSKTPTDVSSVMLHLQLAQKKSYLES